MNLKLSLFTVLAVLLSACGNQATGQKEHTVELKSTRDSVSYGIGSDVGHNLQMNLKQSGLDSLNMDALFSGMRDAMDSTERISTDKVKAIVQAYMMEAQKTVMAKQQAEADASLAAGKAFLAENGKKPGVTTTASGLQYEVLQMGKGPKPVATDSVTVNYKGTLLNGKEFDSSYKHGQPATFSLQDVVPGWAEAVELMPVGSRFKVYIPSELGWGERGAGQDIPGNNVVVFELELLSIPTNK
ncbi:MAG: FKBP-type peptidyl-prolyl cis-trans isomerase [Flavobacteriales bacterium]|jgi:FKBP-type peptidyl-prolyl cis-trans isomerase|nr:FKBP-type peptidyl-prolyl cis-trans isomerase [Flavobacteriales bacterium]MBK6894277.1 FKBP-type peptidyl-prolyl cis-trans isomerase [Flavobacteriales bacterium]MBK7248207.1 FKBP-type peptidyl-prolyl cis-trans isomerase [Flavobacteriales bacterium]MBK7287443.1 FKBP-type peptidyl-prolyl cis-trans isomerase [Flavobacteriales bacterium]MBK9059608.1 FKBP-type peptidyl-prolyl cis-trans isomerase [Flavobacteriales bacterium]